MAELTSATESPPTTTWLRSFNFRRALLLTGIAWLVAIVGLPFILHKRLKVENLDKIQIGMTQNEVEALLGGGPGNYGVQRVTHFRTVSHVSGMTSDGRALGGVREPLYDAKHWDGQDGSITVEFDKSGRTVGKSKSRFDNVKKVQDDWLGYWLDFWRLKPK